VDRRAKTGPPEPRLRYARTEQHYEGVPYGRLVTAAERWFEKDGDNYRGAGWTKSQVNTDTRHRVMLEIVDSARGAPAELLDLGCGTSQFYEYIVRQRREDEIRYSGLDLSPTLLERARAKFPDISYYDVDLMQGADRLPSFDYVVINGIFTFKDGLSQEEMLAFWQAFIKRAFAHARRGMAFNAMSTEVEWERDDLFHLPFDVMGSFVAEHLSRDFVIRHDYGLYEYTTYVYR
jgi:SAM-dependent methyltransferase